MRGKLFLTYLFNLKDAHNVNKNISINMETGVTFNHLASVCKIISNMMHNFSYIQAYKVT